MLFKKTTNKSFILLTLFSIICSGSDACETTSFVIFGSMNEYVVGIKKF